MSEPIKPGDLVIVVRPRRCGCSDTVGSIFVVDTVSPALRPGRCLACLAITVERGAIVAWREDQHSGTEPWRLKKIDPPALPEHVETREELTA